MRGLLQRGVPRPQPGGPDRLLQPTLFTLKPRYLLAKLPEKGAPPRALGLQPQLELGGVLNREALHELPPVEFQIPSQPSDELPAPHRGVGRAPPSRRGFPPCQRNSCFERLQVELYF